MGGLGNQMFQYAAAKALALERQVDLALDLSFLNTEAGEQHTRRQLELNLLHTNYKIATTSDVEIFKKGNRISDFISSVFRHTKLVNEKGFEYDTDFFSYPKRTYLNGFWQSEKYFAHIRSTLLEELVIKRAAPENVVAMKDRMTHSNSVSLHIRRGDYVTNKNAASFHGLTPLDYYYQAIRFVKQKTVQTPELFVFSDDIEWAKEHLKIEENCAFIDFNKNENSIYDLYLMTQCRHNIIANSSFSWWGAWLNQNPDKIVIAPKQWFKSQELNTKDLIPAEWIQL